MHLPIKCMHDNVTNTSNNKTINCTNPPLPLRDINSETIKFIHDDATNIPHPGALLGGGCRGCTPPPPPEMTCNFLIQLVFCQKEKTMWSIGVEVEQEMSAPPPP